MIRFSVAPSVPTKGFLSDFCKQFDACWIGGQFSIYGYLSTLVMYTISSKYYKAKSKMQFSDSMKNIDSSL